MMWKRISLQIDRPLEGLERLGVILGCFLLWGVFVLVLLQMFGRLILKTGLPWPDELARYFHIVLVFLGLAFAHRMRNHVDMLFLTERWPPLVQRIIGAAIELTIVIMSIIIVVGGISLIGRMGAQKSPSLGMPLTYFIGATVLGFALLALQAFRQFIQKFSSSDAIAIPGKKEHLEL